MHLSLPVARGTDTLVFDCPFGVGIQAAGINQARAISTLWAELHTHRLSPDTPEWFAAWQQRIPCGECRVGFNAILAADPPRFTTDDEWLAQTVRWHDAVNLKLGKPPFPLPTARAMYR